jgi:hypothetical protein
VTRSAVIGVRFVSGGFRPGSSHARSAADQPS